MSTYLLSPEAEFDLEEISDHLVRAGGTKVARYVLGEIRRALLLLARMPEIGHIREDLSKAAVKFWPVFSYLIVYNPTTRPLEIVRVLHGNRDIAALLNRGA